MFVWRFNTWHVQLKLIFAFSTGAWDGESARRSWIVGTSRPGLGAARFSTPSADSVPTASDIRRLERAKVAHEQRLKVLRARQRIRDQEVENWKEPSCWWIKERVSRLSPWISSMSGLLGCVLACRGCCRT